MQLSPTTLGIGSGALAALFWAAGFVTARHGIDVGFSPADLTVHRMAWSGLAFLPLVLRNGIGDLNGIGWARGIVLTFLGGPGLAMISYSGFVLVPLGHGGVIQPSCAALCGLLLATVLLKESLPIQRALGAATIVAGLVVIGHESMTSIGAHGVIGDLLFVAAGLCFGTFGVLLRHWRIVPLRGAMIVSVVSLAGLPVFWMLYGFERMIALGLWENLLQAVLQGVLAGPAAIYFFARAVVLLGAGRAAVFPSLVPGFTLLIGFLALGEVPTLSQILGFAIVLIGFRLTQVG